jgi:phage tail-like protein
MSEPAIGYRFKVEIEGRDLGVFTKVDGLGAKYDVLTVKEGGENGFVHKLPGRIEYDDLKLTRPVDAASGELAAWFTGYQNAVRRQQRLQLATASISAYDGDDKVVATWSLRGVFPVRYSGPSFEAGASKVLTETLELSHQGFWG